MTQDVAATVRRFYALTTDPDATEDDLAALLDADVRIVEHPNLVTPLGAERDRSQTLAGRRAGREVMARQAFEVHDVLVDGEHAAVRATWRGTVGVARGPLAAGTELTAQVAAHVTVRDGRIRSLETFDCYAPVG
ncbi:SnoaL-like protein [Actinomycetospora succinea]|uniref:SnoaL-like protein n=1 Tax=Actinomycetospora succinea TaxID=663603 RepID=A0A4R6UQJ5_9PSEU|nr:nuclear transport factor 2 family protein [Actinomycetospora succinea]TDQ47803.1 SnoaL-like protein [Actinomycetospora succinea]